MSTLELILIIAVVLIVNGILFFILSLFIASYIIYTSVLTRNEEGKWGREPAYDDPKYLKMDALGQEWHQKNVAFMTPVSIVNEGLNLQGEYYNFGSDRSVIILPGRSESLRYSYFFAKPYKEQGYNVLVIDPRAHGLSDGIYSTIGFGESRDVLAWAKFLHETWGMQHIVLHGLCVGAASGILAATAENCPSYIEGLIVEGMFANFDAILRTHLKKRKKPTFLVCSFVNMWVKKYTGSNTRRGPMNAVEHMQKPILFLHSREDSHALPTFTETMYNKCASKQKRIVWFETGEHSKVRITHMEKYDAAIQAFLVENFQIKKVS